MDKRKRSKDEEFREAAKSFSDDPDEYSMDCAIWVLERRRKEREKASSFKSWLKSLWPVKQKGVRNE